MGNERKKRNLKMRKLNQKLNYDLFSKFTVIIYTKKCKKSVNVVCVFYSSWNGFFWEHCIPRAFLISAKSTTMINVKWIIANGANYATCTQIHTFILFIFHSLISIFEWITIRHTNEQKSIEKCEFYSLRTAGPPLLALPSIFKQKENMFYLSVRENTLSK